MSQGREIRSYDYVNHPYEQVRDALRADSLKVFQSATKSAASRARSVASELRASIGPVEVAAEISISVKPMEETASEARLQLEWESASMPHLFPFMQAELAIYPLTGRETQLDFHGLYEPPLGPVGKVLNAVAGHRIAEAAVHQFVSDVAGYLRETLSKPDSERR